MIITQGTFKFKNHKSILMVKITSIYDKKILFTIFDE